MVIIKIIESSSNSFIKEIKKLKNKSERYQKGLYIVEGESSVEELIDSGLLNVKYILFTKKFFNSQILKKLENFENIICVSENAFQSISDTKTPQGIMAVVKMGNIKPEFDGMSLVVYLDNVSDPGNVGTIIRTCDAAGVDAVILSPQCSDVYSPKTVRATMGSLFHILVYCEEEYLACIDDLKQNGFDIIAGCLDGKNSHFKTDFTKKSVICLGNETHGISDELINKGVTKIKIPIVGKAESLNVSIAGAVLVYEALRQRGVYNE